MKNFKIAIIILFGLYSLTGCDNFVDVDVPSSQLTGTVIFEDRTTANAAMADIYSKLRDTGFLTGSSLGSGVTLGLYADELTYHGGNDENISFLYNNTLLPSTSTALQKWNEGYHLIYCSNAVIEGCQNSTALSSADKNQFIGEATFVRALVHFYLVNIYDDVPYITSTDYQVNRLAHRIPVSEVYNRITTDLEYAASLLTETYIGASRVRPNRSTVNALLARVYLYNEQWAEASNAASAVLNNAAYVWETDLDKVFLKECTSTIWQFAPRVSGNNAAEGAAYIFLTGPPPAISLTEGLVNSFATNDLRKTHWIKTVSNGTGTWYHSYKYKRNNNTGTSFEYSVIFRLAEQYLIRAEARARQGDLIGAKEDLNKIRQTAGLPNTTAVSADEVVAAVIEERKFELFTEFGHRFFDLKRNNLLNATLSLVKPGWNNTDQHWPIPEKELLANPNLTQNPGY